MKGKAKRSRGLRPNGDGKPIERMAEEYAEAATTVPCPAGDCPINGPCSGRCNLPRGLFTFFRCDLKAAFLAGYAATRESIHCKTNNGTCPNEPCVCGDCYGKAVIERNDIEGLLNAILADCTSEEVSAVKCCGNTSDRICTFMERHGMARPATGKEEAE